MNSHAPDSMPDFTALATRLGGRYTWKHLDPQWNYRYIGTFAIDLLGTTVHAVPVTGKSFTGVRFMLPLASPVVASEVLLRPQGGLDRFGLRVGIDTEVSTGDAAFDQAPRTGPVWRYRVTALALVAAWIFMMTVYPPQTLGWRAFFIGAGVGAGLWLVTLVVLALVFRGTSTSLRTVIGLPLAFALPEIDTSARLAEQANATWSDTTRTKVIATGRESESGKNGSTVCRYVLPSGDHAWTKGQPKCAAGKAVTVTLGSGALDTPWIEKIEKLNKTVRNR